VLRVLRQVPVGRRDDLRPRWRGAGRPGAPGRHGGHNILSRGWYNNAPTGLPSTGNRRGRTGLEATGGIRTAGTWVMDEGHTDSDARLVGFKDGSMERPAEQSVKAQTAKEERKLSPYPVAL